MRSIVRVILPLLLILAVSGFAGERSSAAAASPSATLADQRLVVLETFMRPT